MKNKKSKSIKKPSYLTKQDIVTLRKAKRIFNKIDRNMKRMEAEKERLDENQSEDVGGRNWMENRTAVYDALDFLYNKLSIDAYGYPMFVNDAISPAS